MKMNIRRKIVTASLTFLILGGIVTVAATQGSETDPLVTLSYLTDVLKPSILTQVDEKVQESQQVYLDKLNESITGYTTQMEELMAAYPGTEEQNSSVFSVVDLAQGQKLIGSVGCEIMLRVGTANCYSTNSPGLIDSSEGNTLENGKQLIKNHLYMVTVTDHGVTATAAVKLLVRGNYTIN